MALTSLLPANILAEDERLERQSNGATEALCEYRWNWSVNPDNPHATGSVEAYAKQVGRNTETIRLQVKAFEEWVAGGRVANISDLIALAKYGKDRRPIADAYTAITGVSAGSLKGGNAGDHNRLISAAHKAAEHLAKENGTSIAEEAHAAVHLVLRAEKEKADREQAQKANHSAAFYRTDVALLKARRGIASALRSARGVEFTDAEFDLLQEEIARLDEALTSMRSLLGITSHTDWDAALAALTK